MDSEEEDTRRGLLAAPSLQHWTYPKREVPTSSEAGDSNRDELAPSSLLSA